MESHIRCPKTPLGSIPQGTTVRSERSSRLNWSDCNVPGKVKSSQFVSNGTSEFITHSVKSRTECNNSHFEAEDKEAGPYYSPDVRGSLCIVLITLPLAMPANIQSACSTRGALADIRIISDLLFLLMEEAWFWSNNLNSCYIFFLTDK